MILKRLSLLALMTIPSAAFSVQEKTAEVVIEDQAYYPGELTVQKGTKVTWVNNDPNLHSVVEDHGAFASPEFQIDESFSVVFNQTGDFNYHCTIHPMMHGTIRVIP